MFDFVHSIISWKYWDATLSCLVIIHLISEYWHYAWEYFSGRREKRILEDIHNHRKMSTKTEKLKKIQEDIDLIKETLMIKE